MIILLQRRGSEHGGIPLRKSKDRRCMTLIIACVMTSGWIRSWGLQDAFTFHSGKHTKDSLFSLAGALVWVRYDEMQDEFPRPTGFSSVRFVGRPFEDPDIQWRGRRWGFGVGKLKSEPIVFRTIPYWSLIMPVTLLSAWLLLWRRRKPTSKRNDADPALENGAA